jgi:site-specific recombinase XerD
MSAGTPAGKLYAPRDKIIANFIADLSLRGKKPRTAEAYARDLEQFGRFLAGDTSVGAASGKASSARQYPQLREAKSRDIRNYIIFLIEELK